MTTPGQTVRPASRDDTTSRDTATGWRNAGLAVLAVGAGLFLIWQMAGSLLVIFAGILVAAFLDACARALEPVLPIGRGWRLGLVIVILGVLVTFGIVWGTGNLPEQPRYLVRVIDAQLDVLQTYLLNFGIELFGPDGGRDFSRWFPDHSKLFGHAQMAIGTASEFPGECRHHPVSRDTLRIQSAALPGQHRRARAAGVSRARSRRPGRNGDRSAALARGTGGAHRRHDDMRLDRSLFHRPSRCLPARPTGGAVELHSLSRSNRRGDSDRSRGHAAWTCRC